MGAYVNSCENQIHWIANSLATGAQPAEAQNTRSTTPTQIEKSKNFERISSQEASSYNIKKTTYRIVFAKNISLIRIS